MTQIEQQPDTVEIIGDSKVQHGPLSDRVYLIRLDPGDAGTIVPAMEDLGARHGYSKLFAQVPARLSGAFRDAGFEPEAQVPGFFRHEDDALFLVKYLDPSRRKDTTRARCEEVVAAALSRPSEAPNPLPPGFEMRPCTPGDVEAMVALYDVVFETYPFPIHDPSYLRETMDHVIYCGAWHDGKLVALCSADVDDGAAVAEMTDFATHPEARGKGLAGMLLSCAEVHAAERGVLTGFTIARAMSFGMNIVFSRAGYEFAGRLINNTNIAGDLESMNVWYRRLTG